jgi:DNA-directed RNA polymerase specialized sigma24 family protein
MSRKKSIDVKTYLKEIREKRQHIDRLKERREALHLDVSFGSIDYSADKIISTPKNKLEEAMIRLSDRLERIDRTIARLSVEVDDRIESIESLSDENHRDILFKRYVEYLSFEEISVKMRYAYNYTCNLHGEALKELQKHLNFS